MRFRRGSHSLRIPLEDNLPPNIPKTYVLPCTSIYARIFKSYFLPLFTTILHVNYVYSYHPKTHGSNWTRSWTSRRSGPSGPQCPFFFVFLFLHFFQFILDEADRDIDKRHKQKHQNSVSWTSKCIEIPSGVRHILAVINTDFPHSTYGWLNMG